MNQGYVLSSDLIPRSDVMYFHFIYLFRNYYLHLEKNERSLALSASLTCCQKSVLALVLSFIEALHSLSLLSVTQILLMHTEQIAISSTTRQAFTAKALTSVSLTTAFQ